MAQRRVIKWSPTHICDPRDDRCVRHVEPQKAPGISVRQSPACHGDLCSLFACNGGNWRITNRGTLDRAEWIKGWIWTQISTRGFVNCDEHPLGQRGGGWWADAFRTSNNHFTSGSKLWALLYRHGGATAQTLLYVKMYAQQALQPLIEWGIVSDLNIEAFYIARGPLMGRHDRADPLGAAIQLQINFAGPGTQGTYIMVGQRMPNAIWLWREYLPPHAPHTTGRLYAPAALPAP